MKRVVERPEPAAVGGTHPDAKRLLTAFHRITVICHDCGDVTVLDEAQLAALSAVPTFGDLWRHAFCAPCRAGGAKGPANVELRGHDANPGSAGKTALSSQRLLDRDPADPLPALVRRPLFRR